ncbi:MAG: PAS domain-containing sensor histidine kinase, partial [Bryobacteraceae bacterium]
MPRTDKASRLGYENRIMMLAVLAALPASAVALALLWGGGYQSRTEWTLTVLIVGGWLGFAAALRERVVFPMQTLANLLGALREGDFSIRGRAPRPDDALGEVMREINTLGVT